jgi:hypothetical protein
MVVTPETVSEYHMLPSLAKNLSAPQGRPTLQRLEASVSESTLPPIVVTPWMACRI